MADYKLSRDGIITRTSDNAVINAVPGDPDWLAYEDWINAGNQPAIEPAPVPAEISDRQFFQQLAVAGIITQSEALAAVKTGDVPAALQALINAMPAEDQFSAEMLVSGATVFQRSHPMTTAIGTAYGWNSTQMDDLWRAAAAL